MGYSIYPPEFNVYADMVGWDRNIHIHSNYEDVMLETEGRFVQFTEFVELELVLQKWVLKHVQLYMKIRNESLCQQLNEVLNFVSESSSLWGTFYGDPEYSIVGYCPVNLNYRRALSSAFFTDEDRLGTVEGVGEQICNEIIIAHVDALAFCLGLRPAHIYNCKDSYVQNILGDPYEFFIAYPILDSDVEWMCAADRVGLDELLENVLTAFDRVTAQFRIGCEEYSNSVNYEVDLVNQIFDGAVPTSQTVSEFIRYTKLADRAYHADAGGPLRFVECLLDTRPDSEISSAVKKVFVYRTNKSDVWFERRLETELGSSKARRILERIYCILES
jgi:hypothetical protein